MNIIHCFTSSITLQLISVFSKRANEYEKMYYDILNGIEYASLSGPQQLIIKEGLTRAMCFQKAFLINEPERVPTVCQNYTSYL